MLLLIIAAGLGLAIAVIGMSMAIFSQKLIDDLLPNKKTGKIVSGIILLFLILVIKEVISVVRQRLLIQQSKQFNIRITGFFYGKLLHLPKPFFDTRKTGEFIARLNDTGRIQRIISQLAGNAIVDALILLVTIGFLCYYSLPVGMACVFFSPVFYWLIYKHNSGIIKGQQNIMGNYALTEANYISTLQGIESIKNHNKEQLFTNLNQSVYGRFQEAIFSLGKLQIKLSFWANALSVVFLTGVFLYGCQQALATKLQTGELIAILSLSGSLLPSVASLALITIPINEAKIAFDRMFEFAGIKPEENIATSGEIESFTSLSIDGLSFRFPGRKQLLSSIFLQISKGEIIALMGENGGGKSTLLQIIQKHYQPESGTLVVNGELEFSEISFDNWRNICGVVPQNIHIFNASVLENIAFDDAQANTEKVLQFLKEYGFAPFIDLLPQSYATLVGEEGINLSGGQKQIIALARALYHQPQLLILDEATAAMDRETEQFVLHLLRNLKQKMGVIFISHRLHVIKNFCDRIYILENGSISQSGTHSSLLQTENLYSKYWADLAIDQQCKDMTFGKLPREEAVQKI